MWERETQNDVCVVSKSTQRTHPTANRSARGTLYSAAGARRAYLAVVTDRGLTFVSRRRSASDQGARFAAHEPHSASRKMIRSERPSVRGQRPQNHKTSFTSLGLAKERTVRHPHRRRCQDCRETRDRDVLRAPVSGEW